MNALSTLVANHMAAEEMTLQEVAHRGGISVSTVHAYKTGSRGARPQAKTLRSLAKGLRLDVDVVLEAAGLGKPVDPATVDERFILDNVRAMSEADRQMTVRIVRDIARSRQKGT